MTQDEVKKRTITEKIKQVAENTFFDEFKTSSGETFVTLETSSEGFINYSTRSQSFRDLMTYWYYQEYKKAPPAKQLSEAIANVDAKIKFEAPLKEVFHRVAFKDGDLFLDLHNEHGDWIHITSSGWNLFRNKYPPIKFIRSTNSLSIATPERTTKENIFLLRKYLNLANEDDFFLVLSFIISVFNINAPQIILIFQGQQGCGKTSNTKFLRRLIDPNVASIRSFTNNEDDLLIAANNSFLLAYDNLSGISNKMADSLCRLSTGAGLGKRKLYTNFEEAIISIKRPIILNGIDDLSRRADMADRSLIINLPTISSFDRKSETELWGNFEKDYPKILGALMAILSELLVTLPTIDLAESPRMKDFATWGSALGVVLGFSPNHFLEKYKNSIFKVKIDTIDNNPLITYIIGQLIDNEDKDFSSKYEATSEWILEQLGRIHHPKYSNMPRSTQGVGIALRRIVPILNSFGIEVTHTRGYRGERLNHFYRPGSKRSLTEELYGLKSKKEFNSGF